MKDCRSRSCDRTQNYCLLPPSQIRQKAKPKQKKEERLKRATVKALSYAAAHASLPFTQCQRAFRRAKEHKQEHTDVRLFMYPSFAGNRTDQPHTNSAEIRQPQFPYVPNQRLRRQGYWRIKPQHFVTDRTAGNVNRHSPEI